MKFAIGAPLLIAGACLTLTASLSACGGGTSSPTATTPAPTAAAGVQTPKAVSVVTAN